MTDAEKLTKAAEKRFIFPMGDNLFLNFYWHWLGGSCLFANRAKGAVLLNEDGYLEPAKANCRVMHRKDEISGEISLPAIAATRSIAAGEELVLQGSMCPISFSSFPASCEECRQPSSGDETVLHCNRVVGGESCGNFIHLTCFGADADKSFVWYCEDHLMEFGFCRDYFVQGRPDDIRRVRSVIPQVQLKGFVQDVMGDGFCFYYAVLMRLSLQHTPEMAARLKTMLSEIALFNMDKNIMGERSDLTTLVGGLLREPNKEDIKGWAIAKSGKALLRYYDVTSAKGFVELCGRSEYFREGRDMKLLPLLVADLELYDIFALATLLEIPLVVNKRSVVQGRTVFEDLEYSKPTDWKIPPSMDPDDLAAFRSSSQIAAPFHMLHKNENHFCFVLPDLNLGWYPAGHNCLCDHCNVFWKKKASSAFKKDYLRTCFIHAGGGEGDVNAAAVEMKLPKKQSKRKRNT